MTFQLVYNLYTILFQLKVLKFKDLQFGWETFKQVTHGSISTNPPQCINDLHALMFIVKKIKIIFFLNLYIQTFCVFPSLLVMQFSYHVL
jgi:hypothetical protein